MSRRSSGRHRKSRMPSRRTMTVVTGAAGLVVAVTTGAVPVPLVAPGDAHETDARAEPITLNVDSADPSASQDETGLGAAAESGNGRVPSASQTPTSKRSPSGQASTSGHGSAATPGQGRSRGPSASPAPSSPAPAVVPLPLPSTMSSLPGLPSVASLPGLPTPPVPLLP